MKCIPRIDPVAFLEVLFSFSFLFLSFIFLNEQINQQYKEQINNNLMKPNIIQEKEGKREKLKDEDGDKDEDEEGKDGKSKGKRKRDKNAERPKPRLLTRLLEEFK